MARPLIRSSCIERSPRQIAVGRRPSTDFVFGRVYTRDVGPNITGEIEMHSSTNAGLLYPDAEESGAFYKASYARLTPSGATVSGNHLGLDSSRSSGIFGESETVQPQAIRLLPCVKI